MADNDDATSDRAYDEAIPVETDDEVSTPASSEQGSPGSSKPSPMQQQRGGGHGGGLGGGRQAAPKPAKPARRNASDSEGESSSSADEESTSESGSDAAAHGMQGIISKGAYNPEDYADMPVSADVQELFDYIAMYKPHTIELDTVFKPFIPELIPSIGEVDACLKMPRPDGQEQLLGTARLDEPTLNPSDPSILDLQLRSLTKNQDLEPMEVRSIENAEKNPKEIANWIKSIDELNRSKPAPTLNYSRRMPDIEQLMQVWPAEFEEHLQQNPLPDLSDLELELPEYIKLIASILDVPVHGQLTETLHVIFTLYSEFKLNQHFSKTDGGVFGQNDPYNFGPVPNFAAGAPGAVPTATFGGPSSESMAPSRAPSPVGARQGHMVPM